MSVFFNITKKEDMSHMRKLKGMDYFESIINDSSALISEAVENGGVALGYNCYTVPKPLLSVGNAFPVRMRATQISNTAIADYYMSQVLCSYSRALLEAALSGEYRILDAVIFSSSCQHCNKTNHNMEYLKINSEKENFFISTIDAPQKATPALIELYANSMRKTAAKIQANFGICMSDENVWHAINEHNELNAKLKKLSDFRKLPSPGISGTEFQTVLVASQIVPAKMILEKLDALILELEKRKPDRKPKARLMVVGSIMDSTEYIELIENVGASVVADRYCFGSYPGLEPIEKASDDPFKAMALHYLATCECPRIVESWRERVQKIVERVAALNIDGVIIENIKFCDWWGYEILTMVNMLEERGIPVVKIEREYCFANEGQFRTRVQAFVESIERRRPGHGRIEED